MENFDHILLFKTTLEACNKKLLQELLDNKEGVDEWNIITVHGYECCELT